MRLPVNAQPRCSPARRCPQQSWDWLWQTIRYPLTDPCPFDILQSGTGWRGSNAIRSNKAPRVHHAARRRGGLAASAIADQAAAIMIGAAARLAMSDLVLR